MSKFNSDKKNLFSTVKSNSTIESCLINIKYSYSSVDYTGIINIPTYNKGIFKIPGINLLLCKDTIYKHISNGKKIDPITNSFLPIFFFFM